MNMTVCGAVAVGVVWYCSGLGYVMSVMLEPQNSMVASVAIVLVAGRLLQTAWSRASAPSRPP